MFKELYKSICDNGKSRKCLWKPGSGLHKHHIIPIHHGGQDEEENFTYLTVREHVSCHFLLWKIYRLPNDLRAMHMLGAHLTTQQRKIVGEFCRDNKIGFHKFSSEERSEFGKIGGAKAYELKLGFHSLPEEEKLKNASDGGKIGGKVCYENGLGIFSLTKEERLEASRIGGLIAGPMLKGYVHWVGPNGERTRAKECPGDGWINAIGMTEEGQRRKDEWMKSKKVLMVNIETGKTFYEFFNDIDTEVAEYLLENRNVTIEGKLAKFEKHGVFIRVPVKDTIKYINMGWDLIAGNSDKPTRLNISERNLIGTIKVKYEEFVTAIPLTSLDAFIKDGWELFYSEENKTASVMAYNYRLRISKVDLEDFIRLGWNRCLSTAKQKPVEEKRPGAQIKSPCGKYTLSVHFADIPPFRKLGWDIVAEFPSEIKRIEKQIAKYSSCEGEPLF